MYCHIYVYVLVLIVYFLSVITFYVYVLLLLCCIFFGNQSKRDSIKGDSLRVHRAFGQLFEKRVLVLLSKIFYSTSKSFLVRLSKANIHGVVVEVNGCF